MTMPLNMDGGAIPDPPKNSGDACATILRILIQRGETVGFAESCTGGGVCSKMASVPGASAVLRGGIVAYDPDVKRDLLGVPRYYLEKVGIVSRETAISMAAGAARILNADWGIASTGYAGPGGGDCRYDVGTVCFGIFCRKNTARSCAWCRHFAGNRIIVMEMAARFVLNAASVLMED